LLFISTYDFQLCVPQDDIKDSFESKDLEASFCRDFACCGLVLDDLHDLLQHYEECHVRLEDDENSLFDDEDETSWSASTSPSLSFSSFDNESACSSSSPNSPILAEDSNSMDALKKRAAAYLSDLYNATSSSTCTSINGDEDDSQSVVEETIKKSFGKKRSYNQYSAGSPSALDLLTQSAAKKLALASGDIPTPMMSDEDFLAQAGALLASANSIFPLDANNDKPYKCPVSSCDKAYKNPNGLKYHNQHGHCNLLNDDNDNIASKPYQCTIGDCGKRYKNLNGLKYHIEHSHMTALNQTLATFGSSLFTPSSSTVSSPTSSTNSLF
jgi:hypothetical protein